MASALATVAPRLRSRALERGRAGITALDTAELARAAGLETGEEKDQRARSWHAHAPRKAGLVAGGLSDLYSETGNRLMRYLHPDFVTRHEELYAAQHAGAA